VSENRRTEQTQGHGTFNYKRLNAVTKRPHSTVLDLENGYTSREKYVVYMFRHWKRAL